MHYRGYGDKKPGFCYAPGTNIVTLPAGSAHIYKSYKRAARELHHRSHEALQGTINAMVGDYGLRS